MNESMVVCLVVLPWVVTAPLMHSARITLARRNGSSIDVSTTSTPLAQSFSVQICATFKTSIALRTACRAECGGHGAFSAVQTDEVGGLTHLKTKTNQPNYLHDRLYTYGATSRKEGLDVASTTLSATMVASASDVKAATYLC